MRWGESLQAVLPEEGFTFLELLLVIFMLSLLLTAVSLNYRGVQEEATANLVQADLRVIRGALNFYFMKQHQYPLQLEILKQQGYLEELPDDKFGSNQKYLYQLNSSTGTYRLWSVGTNGRNDQGNMDDICLNK